MDPSLWSLWPINKNIQTVRRALVSQLLVTIALHVTHLWCAITCSKHVLPMLEGIWVRAIRAVRLGSARKQPMYLNRNRIHFSQLMWVDCESAFKALLCSQLYILWVFLLLSRGLQLPYLFRKATGCLIIIRMYMYFTFAPTRADTNRTAVRPDQRPPTADGREFGCGFVNLADSCSCKPAGEVQNIRIGVRLIMRCPMRCWFRPIIIRYLTVAQCSLSQL